MLSKIFRNKYHFIFALVLLFSFLVPFLSIPFFYKYKYIASGDFLPPIARDSVFFRNLFVYNPFFYGGFITGFMISRLFPESFMYLILGYFGLSVSFITLAYISLMILISEISVFYFLIYIFTNKLNINSDRKYFFAIIGSIIYTFSPYTIALISPGHFSQIIFFGLLPLVIIFFDRNLSEKKIQLNIFLKYFIVFLLCSSNFSNIASIYVLMLTLSIYSLLKVAVEKTPITRVVINLFIVAFSLIISNFFWVLSYITWFRQLTNLSGETLQSLDNQVYLSVTKVNIANLFFGRAEWIFYLWNNNYYINNFPLIIFSSISIFFFISILKKYKNKFIAISVSMTLFGIFISKGPIEPFGNLFMWFYHNLFGFQIFRRPISKYEPVFLLFYFALSMVGIFLVTRKLSLRKFIVIVIIPICFALAYLIIIFIKSFQLTPFNIPSYYFEAEKYLIKDKVRQVLILPGRHGLQPTYDKSINNLYASDFLYSTWHFPFDTPVDADFAVNYQKKIINPIMDRIRKDADICDLTKEAGISHIMLRHDISLINTFEDKPKNLSEILDSNKLIVEKKDFYSNEGKGFTIYKINDKCTSNMIQISSTNKVKVDYQLINPVKIKVSISRLKNLSTLLFLNNFQPIWKLYISKYNNNFFLNNEDINVNTYPKKKVFFEGDELQFLTKKPLFEKSQKTNNKSWTNQWNIDPQYIKENYPDSYYQKNSDGSLNLQLTIYFQNQNYLYFGFFLFGVVLLVFPLYFCFYIYKKVSKRSY